MKPRRERVLAGLLCAVGAGLRLARLLDARSLWADEAPLALNLIERSFAGLLRPLEAHPPAGLGFLWLEKLAVGAFGDGETAVRSVPFLASLVALPVFYALARRCLAPPAALGALALFALAEPLVFYSAEAKPYAADLAAATAVLWAGLWALEAPRSPGRPLGLAGVGVLALALSLPAVFVCAGVAGAGVVWLGLRGERGAALAFAAVGTLWAALFAAEWWFVVREGTVAASDHSYWAQAFAPFPPRTRLDWVWYLRSWVGYFQDPVGLRVATVGAATAALGAVALVRAQPQRATLLLAPLLPLLAASALGLYPTASHTPRAHPYLGRLLLFTVPIGIVLLGAGVGALLGAPRRALRAAGVLLGGVLLLPAAGTALARLADPPRLQEMGEVVAAIGPELESDDVVFVDETGTAAFSYYARRQGLPAGLRVTRLPRIARVPDYASRLVGLPERARVWFVLVYNYNWPRSGPSLYQERTMLRLLERAGTREREIQAPGVSAWRYRLRE